MGSSFESGSRYMIVRCSMLWAMVPDIWDIDNGNDKKCYDKDGRKGVGGNSLSAGCGGVWRQGRLE